MPKRCIQILLMVVSEIFFAQAVNSSLGLFALTNKSLKTTFESANFKQEGKNSTCFDFVHVVR